MIVVEGFFDTIMVHQAGYPVVGLIGSTLSRHQRDLLAGHFDRVLLMLDGDQAGRQGAVSIAEMLGDRISVSVISLKDGQQPDDLTPSDIRNLMAPYGSLTASVAAAETPHAQ